jgi:hypothetical protein
MAAPLGSDPTNERLGWAVAHLPAKDPAGRDRATTQEGEDRRPQEER